MEGWGWMDVCEQNHPHPTVPFHQNWTLWLASRCRRARDKHKKGKSENKGATNSRNVEKKSPKKRKRWNQSKTTRTGAGAAAASLPYFLHSARLFHFPIRMERNRSNFPPLNSWKKTWIFPMVDPETNKQSVSWNVKRKKASCLFFKDDFFFSSSSLSNLFKTAFAFISAPSQTRLAAVHSTTVFDDIISIFLPFSGLMQPLFFLAVVSIRKRGRNK